MDDKTAKKKNKKTMYQRVLRIFVTQIDKLYHLKSQLFTPVNKLILKDLLFILDNVVFIYLSSSLK